MKNPFKQTVNVVNNFEVKVEAVRVLPGDTLIVQCERRVPSDVLRRLREQMKDRIPGVEIIVLEAGVKVAGTVQQRFEVE